MKPANLIILFNFIFAVFYPVFSLDYKDLETSHGRAISAYDLNIVVKQHNDGKEIAVEAFSGDQSIFQSTSVHQIDHDLTQYGLNILCNLDGTVQLTSANTSQDNIIEVSDIKTKIRLKTFGKAVLKDLANSQKTIIDAPYFEVMDGNKLRKVYVEGKTTTTFQKGQFENVIFGQKDGSITIDQDAKYNVNNKENGTFYLLKGTLENQSDTFSFSGKYFYNDRILNRGSMSIKTENSNITVLDNQNILNIKSKTFMGRYGFFTENSSSNIFFGKGGFENIRNSSDRTSILFQSSNPILNNIQNSNGAKLTLYGKKCWTWKTPRVVNNGEIHLKSSRSKKIPQSSMEANTLITFGNPNSKQYTRFFGSGEIKSKNITLLFSHRDFNILTHRFTAENIVLINRMMTPSIINRGVLESKNNIELHSVNKVRNSGTISIGKTLYQTGNQEITKSLTFLNRGNFRGMFKNHGALTLDNYGAMNAIINQKYLSKFKNHSGAQGEISIR